MGKSKSKSSSAPVYYPEQRQALQTLLGMSMSHLGGATTYQPVVQEIPSVNQSVLKPTSKTSYLQRFLTGLTQQPAYTISYQPQSNQPDIFTILAQPYTGQLTAQPTDIQQRALSIASQYQPSQLTDEMKNVLLKTLQGAYLPEAINSFYNPMKQGIEQEYQEALTQARQSANLGGMMLSTPRMNLEAKIQAEKAKTLAELLGNIYTRERAYQLEAIPQAMQLEREPLNLAQTLFQLGEAQRQIQQQALEAQYREWLRQLQALGIPLDIAMRLITFSPGQQSSAKSSSWNLGEISYQIGSKGG